MAAPKGKKQSSGLLMSVIRTLSASENYEQREIEKGKLEKAFKESDLALDKLVSDHYEDLQGLVATFSAVSSRITSARSRVKHIKEELSSCKDLLHCKRDELRKLWLEGIEYRQALALLDQVEEMRGVPENVENHINKRHYLDATQLLAAAEAQLDGDLSDVDALKEMRTDIQAKKSRLYNAVLEDLQRHLYLKFTSSILKSYGSDRFERNDSERTSSGLKFSRDSSGRFSRGSGAAAKRQEPPKYPNAENLPTELHDDKPFADVDRDPEADSAHFIFTLVQSLATLGKMPDAMEDLKGGIRREGSAIAVRSTQQILDTTYHDLDGGIQNQPKLLLDLVQLIYDQFRCVVSAHQHVVNCVKKILTTNNFHTSDIQVYDKAEVWTQLQIVLQMLLRDYLDMRNVNSGQQQLPTALNDAAIVDIGSYFAKKRPAKAKKFAIFNFDSSSHAISMNSYLREHRQGLYGPDSNLNGSLENLLDVQQQVCRPSTKNITVIFNTLTKFVKEIEEEVEASPGTNCALHSFVTDFVREIFLGQVHFEISTKIENAAKVIDAWKTVIDDDTRKQMNVRKPLLASTVNVERGLTELCELMYSLPEYADQFLTMVCTILQDYREVCQAAYRDIVQPETEDKRIISATWAKDEDINRFLRSLPNWLSLLNEKMVKEGPADSSLEESAEEIRARHTKESDILTGNLGDTLIPSHEILGDINDLKTLAHLEESVTWFTDRIQELAKKLPTVAKKGAPPDMAAPQPIVAQNLVETLLSLGREFEELAETCLLVLHLEVRVHCFYWLMPVAKQSSYTGGIDTLDPDNNVAKLNQDMANVDAAMGASLPPAKFRYIFEGLGHLVASILINSAQYLKKINENGIKKMCRNTFAIQQTLTNITACHESDLDRTRLYYEMLYHSPDDMLEKITEEGAIFSQLEYITALNLLHRSGLPSANSQEVLQARMARLKHILDGTSSVAQQKQSTQAAQAYTAPSWRMSGGETIVNGENS